MKRRIVLVKGTTERNISADTMAELMYKYGVAGTTHNEHGAVVYLFSRNRKRIHSILISRSYI